MSEHSKIEFMDYLILIVKWKRVLIAVFFISLITSYLCIRFFIKPQFDATAVIIPSEQTPLTGITSLVKNFSAALPGGLASLDKETEMDLYNTILYSRTSIENLIDTFDLQKQYKIKKRSDAIKTIRKMIKTKITLNNAYEINVRSTTPQLAADITNYMVNYLNQKIIELNVSKAKDNRLFLEERYGEIKENLKNAEDSLKQYQEKTGVFEAESQTRTTIETFARLESEIAAKQVELTVLKKIYGENSPIVNNAKISVDEYQKKLEKFKKGQDQSSMLLSLESLPIKALNYYRYYRDVRIYNEMLEFIIPLFEQSKFDEQKMIPILQVIDYAVPPEKKSFPPRTLMSGVIACMITLLIISYLIVKEVIISSNNPKISFIVKNTLNLKKS